MLSNRQTDRQTDRDTDPTTVTLAAHARRGLIILAVADPGEVRWVRTNPPLLAIYQVYGPST